MNDHEASILLEKMLEGVHPMTGEAFPEDHVCNDPAVMRALYKAVNMLRSAGQSSQGIATRESLRSRRNRENNQKPWTPDEDVYLRNACAQNIPLQDIIPELRRSEQKIKLRMVYLGLANRSILGGSIYPETGHAHQGLPWYPEEEERLAELYCSGHTPREMSAEMKRSVNSIMIRLEKLGLIENRHEYTAPDVVRF